jgi:SAM-dependent methyltransferase
VALPRSCRCPGCLEDALVAQQETWDPAAIVNAGITCTACSATYDVIWGVPFFGHYGLDDILGLIEIASNARADNGFAARSDIVRIEGLLDEYHRADDQAAYIDASSDSYAHAPWFLSRYTEYAQFMTLIDGIEFDGADVLDVGAGTGSDTWRLVAKGGRVTALEYNPMLVRRGREVLPEVQWFGGFSHALPFADHSFDIVCCNAALHHMRDIPSAMGEMLRVLRPGGHLLTTGDPFRANSTSAAHELAVFDGHEGVLLGINEAIPCFGTFTQTLHANRDRVDVIFYTCGLFGARSTGGPVRRLRDKFLARMNVALLPSQNIAEIRRWPFDAHTMLANAAGALALRVRRSPTAALVQAPRLEADVILRAGDYAKVLVDFEAATKKLVPLLPERFVDLPFPGTAQTKFELLNGWQKPQIPYKHRPNWRGFRTGYRTGYWTELMGYWMDRTGLLGNRTSDLPPGRIGYRRARWFLKCPVDVHVLTFRVRRTETHPPDGCLEVLLDGRSVVSQPLIDRAWHDVMLPLPSEMAGRRFVCELRLVLPGGPVHTFADYTFMVEDRHFN